MRVVQRGVGLDVQTRQGHIVREGIFERAHFGRDTLVLLSVILSMDKSLREKDGSAGLSAKELITLTFFVEPFKHRLTDRQSISGAADGKFDFAQR
eukprot:CAMPEP_0185591424 /NCGR_PEP_ID=MMETSP0434-20130131/64494_1 /TAXON_ID=626734 ORGANISM="Favella taraikaensis, Strain Fe Narragansett Bay" /NCGR_SAMPLE_ID=MMETSP0434 /ASSEMBLY_ACC=CAM_ASM_000379 /LENGTH=95 /DNA_ID=CAMNT_0028216421 /DNA_START=1953 /DNA_END=2236 /DNA_ORIENTATION=-